MKWLVEIRDVDYTGTRQQHDQCPAMLCQCALAQGGEWLEAIECGREPRDVTSLGLKKNEKKS